MQIVYSAEHRLHSTDRVERADQPFTTEEVPARAEIILSAVQAVQLGAVGDPIDHGLDPILAVHDADFVGFLRTVYVDQAARTGRAATVFADYPAPRRIQRARVAGAARVGFYAFGGDSPILESTWLAAYWSAQCALTGADIVRESGETAYALCRPPGHHADVDLYGGFCYLNNAAIAARYLRARTAILDVDYHHGNGTQAIFYADPTVLYCSIHARPDEEYPYYWGESDERGEGAGLGFNCNWPLPQGADDALYLRTLDAALAAIRDFEPRYLIVSAGFDIAAGDPIGGFSVTVDGFRAIGERIAGLRIPTLIVQEGGYLLEKLGENAAAFLRVFA
ncbi:MAG TPA: histone deacetylase family protein [Anaerolineae bacterium]